MSLPTSTPAWIAPSTTGGIDSLQLSTSPLPSLGPTDVLIRLEAASLNYRDIMLLTGTYSTSISKSPVIPLSDGAGTVLAVGSSVTSFAPGDQVATLFNPVHQRDPIPFHARGKGLGGSFDGVARKHAVFDETGIVKAPKGWSALEAATLSCAAVTAWNALYGLRPLKAGDSVLVQGTGGVSLFALQFAKAAGAFVIATTSSPAKEELLKSLGADVVINYRTNPSWGTAAFSAAPGANGVNHIVEIGGPSTIAQSWKAITPGGIISVIGTGGLSAVDDGKSAELTYINALFHTCVVRGIFVGGREMMLEMVKALEISKFKPVVDQKVFGFGELKEALKYQVEQKHVGKVVLDYSK